MSRRTSEYTWAVGLRVAGWTFMALGVVVAIVSILSAGPR